MQAFSHIPGSKMRKGTWPDLNNLFCTLKGIIELNLFIFIPDKV
jgi:hypothetical protein